MAAYSIGVDLGGTNLRAAAITHDGRMVDKAALSTNPAEGREAVLADMQTVIESVKSKSGSSELTGIGVGVPGFIQLREGVIRNCNNLVCLESFPIRDELSRRLGTPVILENDANAAALGEKWMGAGRDVDDLVLLTLGTGIGGGIVSGGRILHGYLGMAGEIGHTTVDQTGNPCGCGNQGCLEKHASALAVSAMARLMNLGDKLTPQEIHELALAGDEKARRIWITMGEALGVMLATLINIFNFPLYLLSGGMLPAWDFFAPPMIEVVRRRSFTYRNSDTRIDKAVLGNEAGLYGAAYLPVQHL